MKFLIVKLSSLGDIFQCLHSVEYLKYKFPNSTIDFVTQSEASSFVSSMKSVDKVITFDIKKCKNLLVNKSHYHNFKLFLKCLREKKYDAVFDLQGNCKSAIPTFFAKAKQKVGFAYKNAKEWPNVLTTNYRVAIPLHLSMRQQYLYVFKNYFDDKTDYKDTSIVVNTTSSIKDEVDYILQNVASKKIMICLGARWNNKMMTNKQMYHLLRYIEGKVQVTFVFAWGNDKELVLANNLSSYFAASVVLPKVLTINAWYHLMERMDGVIAMDSSGLHLCGLTSTPSFSVFGPTSSKHYQPNGDIHYSFRGGCPYERFFLRVCPDLRSCKCGGCIKNIDSQKMLVVLDRWLCDKII
jgi:heptosyltransferase I